MSRTVVLKFGSSVLRSERDLPSVVREIARERLAGRRVLAVVSAFEGATDDLLKRAQQLGLPPQPQALAALLATGEATSTALLTLALDATGVPVTHLDPTQVGLVSDGDLLDGVAVEVDVAALGAALDHGVVVVPGFVARDRRGRTTVLGRGGSDLTALFLAGALGASCRLLKNVDGLFTSDPAVDNDARRYETATWGTALRLGATVVQSKALRFAREAGLEFEIGTLAPSLGTSVGRGPDRLAPGTCGAAEEGAA